MNSLTFNVSWVLVKEIDRVYLPRLFRKLLENLVDNVILLSSTPLNIDESDRLKTFEV